MELQWPPSFQVLFTFLLFIIMVVNIATRSKAKYSASKNLPPGPWKLPVIGNLHQLVGSLPHHVLRDLANKYGPLMHLKLGEVSTIVVSSPEIAKEVMKTHDVVFASRPQILATAIMTYGCTSVSFAPYGDYWRQLRKIYAHELLSKMRVQSYRSVREDEVLNLIKRISLKTGSTVNLTSEIYSSTYSISYRAAFGKRSKDLENFIHCVKESMKLASGFNLADVFPSVKLLHLLSGMKPKLERLHKEADRIMENIINEHKEDKTSTKVLEGEAEEDLLDVLLKFHEHGGGLEFSLTTENIKAVIIEIFGGGGETSSTTVDWAMSEMIKNPRIMKMAQNEVREVFNRKGIADETSNGEMKYLDLVIKETLRLHPSNPLLLPRECSERCEIDGYEIPVKTKVVINAWAIATDPSYWTEPESFTPERFLDSSIDYRGLNFEYIPFGAGRRICPGISFGLANVKLQLAMLLYHFDWKLPKGMKHDDLDMTEAFGVTSSRKQDLHLIPIPYHHPPTEKAQV
ncbi:cytochrome P450 71D9-like [Rosa rugosa]|uniref:cytochrome P450 71D9-like n=1 Tax=Rosa rugosa TaxID=74645 RepID=UPI002B416EE2|nr:cytochrome P450 71D9-like [Rosa rugosa]